MSGAAAQPRRLALLALLAVAGDRGVTREALLGYLWPEADEERGRRALAQALYALRRDLGSDEAVVGVKDLRLNPDVVRVDLWEFRDATASGELDRAAELYRGRFLEGFHLPGAGSFEGWVESERVGLAHQFADLLHQLAERAGARGEHRAAAGWWRRLAAQDPLNARVACRLMESLAALGDVAGALQHARVYEVLVRQELDLPPDREVLVLATRLREIAGTVAPTPVPAPTTEHAAPPSPPPPAPSEAPVSVTESAAGEIRDQDEPVVAHGHTSGWATLSVPPLAQATPSARRRPRWATLAGVTALVIAALIGVDRHFRRPPADQPAARERVVAVGRIAHYAESGVGGLGQPLADMLATNLARVAGVRVISSARMHELLGELSTASDTTAGLVVAAARRAGATELVDGALYDVSTGHHRLDLRRVDLTTGAVLQAYTIQGPDLFTLADSGTGRLVGDLGGRAPAGSLAEVSTRSVEAYRAYEAGLRAYFRGDTPGAERLLAEALRHDSTFAMAQFYYSLANTSGHRAEASTRLKRAVDLAERASDRERLLIRATWAFLNSSPSIRAYAETLTVRYPAELEGFLMAGQGAILAADFHAARQPLLAVIERDSLGLRGKTVRCLACEALEAMIGSLIQEDSLAAAVEASRRWIRLQPGAARPWRVHAMVLGQSGQMDSARSALRHADSLDPGAADAWRYVVQLEMWDNQFRSAGEMARAAAHTGPQSLRLESLWVLSIIYRHQGRLREALESARRYRKAAGDPAALGAAPSSAMLEGQVLFELGRLPEAAALFDSLSRGQVPFEDSASAARTRIWAATHMATAMAAAGDTARLAGLADSLQRLGQVSGLGRDRRLHHYVRGLLLEARGADQLALAEFRDAITSRNSGYTRIGYELAGALLRLGRAREAVAVLQPITRGSFEGASLYLTHSDAHERLARVWEAAGQADSAAYHYRLVAKLWEDADPEFTPRRLEAAGRAMQLLDRR